MRLDRNEGGQVARVKSKAGEPVSCTRRKTGPAQTALFCQAKNCIYSGPSPSTLDRPSMAGDRLNFYGSRSPSALA
jgi:hypothetical protein